MSHPSVILPLCNVTSPCHPTPLLCHIPLLSYPLGYGRGSEVGYGGQGSCCAARQALARPSSPASSPL
eukprot:652653-Rhodomonas_salina.1